MGCLGNQVVKEDEKNANENKEIQINEKEIKPDNSNLKLETNVMRKVNAAAQRVEKEPNNEIEKRIKKEMDERIKIEKKEEEKRIKREEEYKIKKEKEEKKFREENEKKKKEIEERIKRDIEERKQKEEKEKILKKEKEEKIKKEIEERIKREKEEHINKEEKRKENERKILESEEKRITEEINQNSTIIEEKIKKLEDMVKKEEEEKAKKDEKEGRWTKFEKIGSIYHSKNEIRKMLLPILKYESEPDKFSNQPKIKSPYNSGKLSEETNNIALQYLNSYRFCAGIPCDVKIDSSYEKLAQDAALLMKVNNLLEHTGQPKPRNMNDNLYKSGSKGCSSCNIALGYSNLFTAINGWILDDGLISVGHRRWILNPPMTKTGFGGVSNFHAMYSFDGVFQNTEYKNSMALH